MKRVNNLYPVLVSDDNLTLAILEVNKSHRWERHHRPNRTVLWVEKDIPARVKELREIIERGFVPSPVKSKRIYDHSAGKWRDITEPKLWPDQYVHHAIIQALQPVFMRGMDRWCCGSIKGRGIHYGSKGLKKWMKSDRKGTKYCAELDIRHYYNNITKETVIGRCKQLIKDGKMLSVIEDVLQNGVLIGCYFSQWFANVILQPLDHKIRESGAGVKRYIRYMDNFTLFSSNKRNLGRAINMIEAWLVDHKLRLKENWQKFKVSKKRIPNALGYRFGRGYTLIRKKTLLRVTRGLHRLKYMENHEKRIPPKFAAGLLSRIGMLKHCNSVHLRERLFYRGLVKRLKNIVRQHTKKERAKWTMCLA